jgi:hypothetical protein
MTKRFLTGVLLGGLAVLVAAMAAQAELPMLKEWKPKGEQNPMLNHELPLFFRSTAGTTWVLVSDSDCEAGDTTGSPNGQTPNHVWCFEGDGGDSTWPANPGTGDSHNWDHWSLYNPPEGFESLWHTTTFLTGPSGGTYNAWCGCDSTNTPIVTCQDMVAYWTNKTGYGNRWDYTLNLQDGGANAALGGTIEFDVRYDVECNYDYLFLEYLNTAADPDEWMLVTEFPNGTGREAIFNGVSGLAQPGRHCGEDYFSSSDEDTGGVKQHGNSSWIENVQFPIPNGMISGFEIRWKAYSDQAWSDQDARGDTDGIGAVDNVLITFTSGTDSIADDFESNNFVIEPGNDGSGAAQWVRGVSGSYYDGWHLELDPQYKNKGNTCTFSDDWMWAAKPAGEAIPENNFDYIISSPVIDTNGWSGGVVEYAAYQCADGAREDYMNQYLRIFSTVNNRWSIWLDFDGSVWYSGCDFWNMNDNDDVTEFLGPEVDSLQFSFEIIDVSQAGEWSWGKHGGVQYLIDHVSFGSFDGTATIFDNISPFCDTFSKSDPAHTAFLQNKEQGNWIGIHGGGRLFTNADSMNIEIHDQDGISQSNVTLYWRHDAPDSTPTGPKDSQQVFTSWFSKTMDFAVPDPQSDTDEGTYRAIIGNDGGTGEDYSFGKGHTPPSEPDSLIWVAGTTVEYYVKARDNATPTPNFSTWPSSASDTTGNAEFSILPFGLTAGPGNERILVVDDFPRVYVDWEASRASFNPSGGLGFGAFDAGATFDAAEDFIERALALLYGGSEEDPNWDKYDVSGAGSNTQMEPRGVSVAARGLGAYMDDLNQPVYDLMIWTNGRFDTYAFYDTTRIELMNYLERGGNLFLTGDEIAYALGPVAGQAADSVIHFIDQYLGIVFAADADNTTDDKVLNVEGIPLTSLADVKLGIYGECPLRLTWDRLSVSTFPDLDVVPLATYQQSSGTDNGRIAIMKATRTDFPQAGSAVTTGFDLSCLLSDAARACILGRVIVADFGMSVSNTPDCLQRGNDAPQIASGFGFNLAAASPNPFSNSTSIRFSVPGRTHVKIDVFNILGQRVRTLVDEPLEADSYVREWDGRADGGEWVSSGIYFYKMVAGEYAATKKAVLLR